MSETPKCWRCGSEDTRKPATQGYACNACGYHFTPSVSSPPSAPPMSETPTHRCPYTDPVNGRCTDPAGHNGQHWFTWTKGPSVSSPPSAPPMSEDADAPTAAGSPPGGART